jgi:hypothetical protein
MRHPRNDSQRARPATDLAPVVRRAEHALTDRAVRAVEDAAVPARPDHAARTVRPASTSSNM